MKKKPKRERWRIRKCGMEALYVNRQGQWTTWKKATTFTSQDLAVRFAEKHNLQPYGLFSHRALADPTEG